MAERPGLQLHLQQVLAQDFVCKAVVSS